MLIWTRWSWSLSVFSASSSAICPTAGSRARPGLSGCAFTSLGVCRSFCTFCMWVNEWVVLCSSVSTALSQAQRYRTQRAPVSDVTLVKTHSLKVCESLWVLHHTLVSAAAHFHECSLIGSCIPQDGWCSKAHCLLIAEVSFTFWSYIQIPCLLNNDEKICASFIFKRVLIWLLESL